ncbi:hypothetical protein HN358_01775 [Candidatus Uhrbacteria bacterium]|jgi:uncharacterized repeat protein (TIGR01451 family)|nr:hypothetical protein [Candidatus Uhrbacteria bacterium]MBT7716836.1 hypothetical protein [Candidatus Uhrbacteria bacterium]
MTPKEPKTTHTKHKKPAHTKKPVSDAPAKSHTHAKHTHHTPEEDREQLMDEGLEAIYGDGAINFEKLDRNSNKLTRILIAAVVILSILAVTSWAGFFAYTKLFEVSHDENFTLDIVMQEELVSGQTTQIEIQYANPTTVPIASLDLDINLPSAFRVYSFSQEPANLDDLIWEIGSIPGMTDNKITIDGVWIAEAPSETPVQAYATYKPGNFNSDFEDIAVVYVTTLESTLVATIEGPEEASAGEDLDYTISVENSGEEPFENVLVSMDLPQGFYLESSDPELEAGGPAQWTIEYIDTLETIEITFSGVFASNVESFQYFDVAINLMTENREVEQSTAQAYTDVMQNDISVRVVANGATDETSVDVGGALRMSIGLENTQDAPIENLTVLLDFQADDSIPIAWSSSTLDSGTITSDGIYWQLDSIEPGEKILINTSFPIDSELGVGDADNFNVIASTTYSGRTVLSSPMEVSINSQADLQASVRYYEESGAALGNGPLPPQVGQTTTYRVIWTINNSLHDLEDITVSADLPPHVVWAGNATRDLGSINYNSSEHSVSWTIDSLSLELSNVQGEFSISITPDSNDIGSFIKLISGSDLSATDSSTDESLSDETDSLTTDLEDDLYASVEGGVVIE